MRAAWVSGTPSGKVELRSGVFADLGLDPLPTPPTTITRDADYPYLLIAGSHFNPMYHSEQRQWPSARTTCPDPQVSIHPTTAAGLGLAAGDLVRITTRHGSIRQRVKLDDRLDPRVVDTQHGWWFPERSDDPMRGFLEANCNVLVSDAPEARSPGTGGWRLTGACRVRWPQLRLSKKLCNPTGYLSYTRHSPGTRTGKSRRCIRMITNQPT